ncbi:polyprenyl diphosphate synthase [Candidatus Neptunochlamydia vexilliferae]|nr:polyprenyl diphosphate synthase [Candidatus Neptunochlamydia vexilliferae]
MGNNVNVTEAIEEPIYTEEEFAAVDPQLVPHHVAIVMDGNRRWAKKQGKPGEMGHWYGAENLDLIVRAASELGIKTLTAYSFSTENWNRSPHEVEVLMQLLEAYLINKREELVKEGVKLHTIGDIERFPSPVKKALEDTIQATKNCDRIDLVLALNYGGRDEIRRAMLKMEKAAARGEFEWENITEETISSYLDTAPWPDPELLIRPSGEQRVSNFLIWQISYSEIYVTDVLWPDFSKKNLLEAIIEYQNRSRRFGT